MFEFIRNLPEMTHSIDDINGREAVIGVCCHNEPSVLLITIYKQTRKYLSQSIARGCLELLDNLELRDDFSPVLEARASSAISKQRVAAFEILALQSHFHESTSQNAGESPDRIGVLKHEIADWCFKFKLYKTPTIISLPQKLLNFRTPHDKSTIL